MNLLERLGKIKNLNYSIVVFGLVVISVVFVMLNSVLLTNDDSESNKNNQALIDDRDEIVVNSERVTVIEGTETPEEIEAFNDAVYSFDSFAYSGDEPNLDLGSVVPIQTDWFSVTYNSTTGMFDVTIDYSEGRDIDDFNEWLTNFDYTPGKINVLDPVRPGSGP
jgi:hypothetical protein